jgi:hypothetical protein
LVLLQAVSIPLNRGAGRSQTDRDLLLNDVKHEERYFPFKFTYASEEIADPRVFLGRWWGAVEYPVAMKAGRDGQNFPLQTYYIDAI